MLRGLISLDDRSAMIRTSGARRRHFSLKDPGYLSNAPTFSYPFPAMAWIWYSRFRTR